MNDFRQQTTTTDDLKQLFPDLTPVSEAPPIESQAQFEAEWFKRYSAARVEGRTKISYWEVQNPHLLKWQSDRFDKVLFRVKPKMIFPQAKKASKQAAIGYEQKKAIGHEPTFNE